ncbi:LysE family translocator [Chondrinema litorale]|uniref:LysE family translocator n=1 Tax=Chondrinema litorale TaxID=2994555 RepID=UPI002542FFB9|nr:LysE family translocator [Chondrinema litorale]UZR95217.1 LysE family translocator [Chondrinema litorale]
MLVFPELENILLFITAATILIVIPGPAVLYIMAKSMEQGYKAGIASVLGIGLGGMVHVVAAGVGVSAILVASATAFSILKYLGAFYLIYLGIKKLFDKTPFHQQIQVEKKKVLSRIFYEGIIVNVLNPKAAIFFFAFLPQFISVGRGGVTSQIFILGFLFILIALASDLMYVFISGKFANWMRNSAFYAKFHKYIIGFIYIFLGLVTLTASQPSNNVAAKKG